MVPYTSKANPPKGTENKPPRKDDIKLPRKNINNLHQS
uniref:Uncharacterized protein n=1 Tax=Rhizophora mucronata TaxID=61149 RepID=A0A2P2N6T7_RHIMU